ncbi:MAG TPA: substrate-binding domain-containing protein [Polyangiaceae bacterium]|nr:substrate-binding domain-containing protein [Polyangiaceae bacterium]
MSRALAATVLVVLASASGCKRESPPAPSGSTSASTSAKAPRRYVVGMSQCNLGEPWRVQMNADIARAAAKHPELELRFKDAQNDSLRQRAQVEELAAQGIDLLIVSPKESAPLTKPIADVYKRGVPVIVLDRAVEGDEYTTFIGADNQRIGREAGKHARKILGSGKNVVELKGLMTSTPGRDRHAGFREGLALENDAAIRVVFEADMQWLEPNARKEMESALASQKSIDLVYAHNDPGAHGAWLAAKAAGREKQMKFIGIDALPHEGVRYVREGILDATFLYPTGGEEAVELAIGIFAGKKPEKKITLGTRLYTKENVEKGGEAIE